MNSRGLAILAFCFVMMVAPAAMADSTIWVYDNQSVEAWSLTSDQETFSDLIGTSTFETTAFKWTFTTATGNVKLSIFSNYPLGGTDLGTLHVPMADIAIDLNKDGLYEKGIVFSTERTQGVYNINLGGPPASNANGWSNSQDLFKTTSGATYGGEYADNSNLTNEKLVYTLIKSGTFSSGLASAPSRVSDSENYGGDSTSWRIDLDLGNVNTGGAWNDFTFLFGTGTCANDVIAGSVTSTAVPEPATMLLLGSGLIGLAGYGRKKFCKK